MESRVRAFFKARPDLGDRFLQYMRTKDASVMTDDVFEFVALATAPEEFGYAVLDLDTLPRLE